jgi:hypothetical protein
LARLTTVSITDATEQCTPSQVSQTRATAMCRTENTSHGIDRVRDL